MALRPLEGFVVGITADRRWEDQAELLRRRGASVVHGPTLTTLYLASDEDLRSATLSLIETPPDYLVATTGIGVRAWLETAAAWGLREALVEAFVGVRTVARGPKAAAAVQAAGLEVWQRSSTEQLDDVVAILLAEPLEGRSIAIQQYGMESPELTGVLSEAGARVVEVPVYRWRLPDDTGPALRLVEAALQRRVDAVTFTSAPAVHNLFAVAAAGGMADRLRDAFNTDVAAACVGPVCAQAAVEEGVDAPVGPEVGRLGLLVRSVSDHLQGRRRTFTVGATEIVLQGSAIEVDGHSGELTPKERAVFDLLARRAGAVVARDTLLEQVWGSSEADPHVLEVTVGRLRRRLGAGGALIETSTGRGYRLAVEVSVTA